MESSDGLSFWEFVLTFACRIGVRASSRPVKCLGVVTDATGASIAGATVTVTNVDTGIARKVKTDDQGRYDASDLNIGNYQVEVQMQGFARQVHKDLTIAVGQKHVVDFKLEVGTVTQEVTVSSSVAAQVNTTTSEVGGLVNEQQMQELPLNGRDYEQLFALVPGVQQTVGVESGANFGSAPRFSVAGSRVTGGSVLLDGMEVRTFWGAGGGLTIMGTSLGVDGVAEFQALTSTFSAQYSGLSVLNEVTRSGTNGFHGSAYGFFRNSAMDARNYFDPASGPPAFHRNQFGGTLGGPIKKNKTFFFVNYEGLRATLALQNTEDVPNANAHNGFLPCTQATNLPCVGGLANVGVNAAIVPFIALYPIVTGNTGVTALANGTDQFVSYGQQPQTENYLAAKIDHQISTKNSFAFRYVFDRGLEINPWANGGNPAAPGLNAILPNFESDPEQNQYFTVQDRHIFSDSLINVASLNFVRTNQQENDDLSKAPAIMTFITGRPMGSFSISNVATTGTSSYLPLHWLQNNLAEQDEVDWVRGAHTLKFGGGVTRIQCNCEQVATPGGIYAFSAIAGGPTSGLEAFLQDKPFTLQGPIPGFSNAQRYGRQTNISVFAQDYWKVRKTLTLNLGIRYDFITNPTEATGLLYRITTLDPYTCSNNPACGTPEPGISGGATDPTGYTHESHYFEHNPSAHNIDPRIGLAWDILGHQKTSFRAGYGLFHSPIYPREYIPGGSFAYPQVQGLQHTPTFPNALAGGLGAAPVIARSQAAWNYRTSYMYQYSATLERQLPGAITASLGYVGSSGVHLIQDQEGNANIPTAGTQFRPLSPTAGAACAPACTAGYGVGGAGYTPNSAFGPIELSTGEGNSHYNSMVLEVKRNLGKGIQFQSGFTWSRSIDWGSSGLSSIDVANNSTTWLYPLLPKSYNKSPSAFDVQKNWTSNALIPLPFHGNQFKEGWQISLISTVRDGSPFTANIGSVDTSNLGQYTYAKERPNVTPGFTGPLYLHTVAHWYNPAAFTLQAPGTIGNESRNILVGPGLFNMDVSLMKSTRIPKLGEGTFIEIRGDFFNILNHTNFGLPNQTVFTSATASPTAGALSTTVTSSRQLQFSAKLVF